MYTKGSSSYHRWLAKGGFDARYTQAAAERAAVASYLRESGLTVSSGASPFLLRATGSSQRIQSAFRTTLSTYVARGEHYFANSSAIRLPAAIARGTLGVIGLTNTIRLRSMISRIPDAERPAARASTSTKTGASSSPRRPPFRLRRCCSTTPTTTSSRRGATAMARPARACHRRRRTRSTARPMSARAARARASTWACSSCPPTRHRTSAPGRTRSTGTATSRGWSTSTSTAARSTRSARRVTSARRTSTSTPATSRSTPTSSRTSRSPQTTATSWSTTHRTTRPARLRWTSTSSWQTRTLPT